ncbi:MAG: PH domain-containing protein [Verrucomicrobia bacterium]|nr:PH domain-containing protein [Verrucomicrobiota bacterium]
MKTQVPDEIIYAIERPCRQLMTYYFLGLLITGPLFPILILPAYFRYHTMRYRFDAEGISMRWGILFRREVILNYSRIQDIHLTSNFVERWLGLARIQIQTAAGSGEAEMTIEGLREFDAVRDFLYSKMRGMKERVPPAAGAAAKPGVLLDEAAATELLATLRAVASELRGLRADLAARQPPAPPVEPAP